MTDDDVKKLQIETQEEYILSRNEYWNHIQRLTTVETGLSNVQSEIHKISDQIKGLVDAVTTQSNSNQWTLQGTLGVIGALAVWSGLLAGGIWFLVDQANQPTRVVQEMLLEDYKSHKDNHGHPKVVADVAKLEQAVKMGEVQHNSHTDRIKRMEEWYNGHGQRMAQDIIKVESMVKALEPKVDSNVRDLHSMARFNMDDFERMVAPQLADIIKRINSIESSRYTAEMAREQENKFEEFNEQHSRDIQELKGIVALLLRTVKVKYEAQQGLNE